jgi:hypothetical protein
MTERIIEQAVFIDTASRDLMVSVVSVTRTQFGGIVLRFGGEVGKLERLPENYFFDLPVMVSLRGYNSRQSAGYVKTYPKRPHDNFVVVGCQGMPWQKGSKSLIRLNEPFEVQFFPAGGRIEAVETHHRPGRSHSNKATARAASLAIKMMASIGHHLLIEEGQSDYARAWRLEHEESSGNYFISREHREDIFSSSSLEYSEEPDKTEEISSSEIKEEETQQEIFDLPSTFEGEERRSCNGAIQHRHGERQYWHPVQRIHRDD